MALFNAQQSKTLPSPNNRFATPVPKTMVKTAPKLPVPKLKNKGLRSAIAKTVAK